MYTDKSVSKYICQRFGDLQTSRGTWESHWQEAADLTFPNHPTFVGSESPGLKKGLKVYDSTAIHAAEILAAGLHGTLTNPASEWFTLKFSNKSLNDSREASMWLASVEKIMRSEIQNSKSAFSTHIHEMYLEFASFGTGILFTGEQSDKDGILFKSIPLSEAYIAENKDGKIDTLYRLLKMSVRQIIQKFGDNASDKTKKLYKEGKVDQLIEVIHSVEPRTKFFAKNDKLDFVSVYVEKPTKVVLQEGGFDKFPYSVPRFYKASGETYGRGPAITALSDIKMLNEMMKTTIKAAQKIVDPPLQAPDDGFLGPIRTIPGGINYFRRGGSDRIEPLMTNGNIPISLEMMEELRNRIRAVFFIDQLQLMRGPEMTATEVMQRTEERMRLMGPVLGRMQEEALDIVIIRAFDVLQTQGKFPPIPFQIEDSEYEIEYVSPIARAQKQLEANSLQRVMEIMTPFVSMTPEIIHRFDADEILKGVSEMFGLRPSFLKSDQEVEAAAAAMREQQSMANNVETLRTGSEAGLNLAKMQEVRGGGGG